LVTSPFLIEVFDSTMAKQGQLGSYTSARFVPSHNEVGAWTIGLRLGDTEMVNLLAKSKRRIKVTYRGNFLMSGPVVGVRRTRTGQANEIEVRGLDDLVWLVRRLAYANPAGVIPADGVVFSQTTEYDTRSGDAETVIKGFVTANAVTRFPVPRLAVATNLNRGATTKQAARFDPLFDIAVKAANAGGLGIQIRQIGAPGAELVFDVYQPQTQAVRLSEKLGNLQAWEYVFEAPAATRVLVAGRGDGVARKLVKQTLASSETDWEANEQFVDARDLELDADLAPRGQEFLAENAPSAGFSIVPNDTVAMAFGTNYGPGDRVVVEVADGVTVTDVVKRATITHDTSGLKVEPAVGNLDIADKPNKAYKLLTRLKAAIARRERST